MPSPLGHALAGFIVHLLTGGRAWRPGARLGPGVSALPSADASNATQAELRSRRRIAVVVGAAVAPDLDLALHLVDGRIQHQGFSHSIGAAALAGLGVCAWARWRGWPRPLALGALATGGWLSHLFLDWLGRDTNPPIGIPALWPFSDGYYKFPFPLFLDIGRTLAWETVFHDAAAVAWEVALLAPVVLLMWRWRAR